MSESLRVIEGPSMDQIMNSFESDDITVEFKIALYEIDSFKKIRTDNVINIHVVGVIKTKKKIIK